MKEEKSGSVIRVILTRRMLVAFIMGFTSGLPLLLTITILQAWMKQEGIDLTLIGLTALFGIPYNIKFIWAPFLDRYTPPFLGRRRGWLLIAQIILTISIAGMGLSNPKENPMLLIITASMVTLFSAFQDTIIDAYRREDIPDKELGMGSSLYVNGYLIASKLLVAGGGLILADRLSFRMVYLMMAGFMLPGIVTTLLTKEPIIPENKLRTLKEAIVEPLRDYFKRDNSISILAFILLYKIGDTMASAITTPFYMDIGFSLTEIGAIVKLFGFWATIGGTFLGGAIMLRLGINRSLWIFGFLQAISTAGFAVLAKIGNVLPALAGVIAFENITSGMGTSAYMAFMASLTNKRFTATQYALLTSLMAIPRTVLSAPTGFFAKHLGWVNFFIACVLIAIPGMLLLLRFAHWKGGRDEEGQ